MDTGMVYWPWDIEWFATMFYTTSITYGTAEVAYTYNTSLKTEKTHLSHTPDAIYFT